jgi:hypothetical protein
MEVSLLLDIDIFIIAGVAGPSMAQVQSVQLDATSAKHVVCAVTGYHEYCGSCDVVIAYHDS